MSDNVADERDPLHNAFAAFERKKAKCKAETDLRHCYAFAFNYEGQDYWICIFCDDEKTTTEEL